MVSSPMRFEPVIMPRPNPPVRFRAHCSIALVIVLAVSGCAQSRKLTATPSHKAIPSNTLKAGFARVDITPPPGAGLMGYGPDGPPATGHRQRLFARAMYLEDKDGERLAIVSLDLGESSIVLHRQVARALSAYGIGADRLFLSATHTHSGPSHFFGVPAYDELGSAVAAYDSVLTDTLVKRITRAVLQAHANLQPARAAWGLDTVWRFTRIRSFSAYRQNGPGIRESLRTSFAPHASLSMREAGVDPTFAMLRVDVRDPVTGRYRRAGAFSVFALHGTAIPSSQTLYDSDVHGRIATLMEQYLDPSGPRHSPRAVYLLVNGGHGDVSPHVDVDTRCPTPRFLRNASLRGPRGASFETTWKMIPRDTARDARCMPLALREMERIAGGIAARAKLLYESLGSKLTNDLSISSASLVLEARKKRSGALDLCPPKVGVAAVLGAEDGWSRIRWDWDLLFSDSTKYPPTPSAGRSFGAGKCQGRKRIFLWPFENLPAGSHALPTQVPLSLIQVGPIALTVMPGEPTTHSAWTIRRATASALFGERSSADSVLMVSLTNGYIQYLATPKEYALQFYEGATTIYGPTQLDIFSKAYVKLASELNASPPSLPAKGLSTLTAWAKPTQSVTQWDEKPAATAENQPWQELRTETTSNNIQVEWIGPAPSSFYTSEGPSTFFELPTSAGGWHAVAWDNLPEVEVQVVRQKPGLAKYRVTWTTTSPPTDLRVRLVYRGREMCHHISREASESCQAASKR